MNTDFGFAGAFVLVTMCVASLLHRLSRQKPLPPHRIRRVFLKRTSVECDYCGAFLEDDGEPLNAMVVINGRKLCVDCYGISCLRCGQQYPKDRPYFDPHIQCPICGISDAFRPRPFIPQGLRNWSA